MSEPAARNLDRWLKRRADLDDRERAHSELAARARSLRAWQAVRLARTYADLRRDPGYAPATEFFLRDLYGAEQFATRERQLARGLRLLRRWLPAAPLRALGRAIELDTLTRELDQEVASRLKEDTPVEDDYARAYRAAGRRTDRERQIELVIETGRALERAVRHSWTAPLLKAAHRPAHAAGLGELQDFLERGYQAFRAVDSPERLFAAIRERETALMDALFAGTDPPFDAEDFHA